MLPSLKSRLVIVAASVTAAAFAQDHQKDQFVADVKHAINRMQRQLGEGFQSREMTTLDGLVNTHLTILENWDVEKKPFARVIVSLGAAPDLEERLKAMMQRLRDAEALADAGLRAAKPAPSAPVAWPPTASDLRQLFGARGFVPQEDRLSENDMSRLAALLRLENETRISTLAGVPQPAPGLLRSMALSELAGLFYEAGDPQVELPDGLMKKLSDAYNSLPPGKRMPEDRAAESSLEALERKPLTARRLAWLLRRSAPELSAEDWLSLNASLMTQGYRERGLGYAMGAVRDLYRALAARERVRPTGVGNPPSLADIYPWLSGAEGHAPPWDFRAGLGDTLRRMGEMPGWRPADTENFWGNRGRGDGGASGGGSVRSAGGGFDGTLRPFQFTDEENACLARARSDRAAGSDKDWNRPFTVTTRSRPGGVSHCAGGWIREGAQGATPSDGPGLCVANFLTAKHCIEPGDIVDLRIRGVEGIIRRIGIQVQSKESSKTGKDDIAIIQAELPCNVARTLPFQEVATRDELETVQSRPGGQNFVPIALGLNDDINVDKPNSPTQGVNFGIGRVGPSSPNFMTINVSHVSNGGHPIRQGDSGGMALACLEGSDGIVRRKVAGALSFKFNGTPLGDGRLGGIASGGSLDWIHEVLKGKASRNLLAMETRPAVPAKSGQQVSREMHLPGLQAPRPKL